ncbi:MAG TPA: type II toxin-antitoxin system VapC family toxin, partial [Pirellulales bacterium]|nr:type II toxin-antitoxin system VapC family toxin [Pirellulales bacterium]
PPDHLVMQYLLDTNTCIAAMKNHPSVVARMSAAGPAACVVSTITIYELYTGVEKCADPTRERSKVSRLLASINELTFDSRAAKEAANLRAQLEAQGQMIGPYDVLLAGHAKTAALRLVTHNTAEFARVPGLPLDDWQVGP